MAAPQLSAHFARRRPSVIRLAQIEFAQRRDGTEALNVAIGNVSLPMHPAMQARLHGLGQAPSPFADGVVKYTATVGLEETGAAFLNVIAASGCATDGLHAQVTDGGSQAMELVVVGCCGPAGSDERPLLLIDAAYTNYKAFAERLGRRTVSITRTLGTDGRFSLPSLPEIEQAIATHRPGAMVVIPYDNPTGQLYTRDQLVALARLCVEHGMWLVSDEAYRELHYVDRPAVSVWSLTEVEVPGIGGRRLGIETASKVWNACGLRIGALVTDNEEFHARAVAENTASLCPNAIGQWIFGALAHESHADLQAWFTRQRDYYRGMLTGLGGRLRELLPGIIVSRPDAAIYSVVDVREIVPADFDALPFVLRCARTGRVDIDGKPMTLLTAPMAGFYSVPEGEPNPGRTQLRIAYVHPPERMALVPTLLAELLQPELRA
ncbi:MAG: aminotransferase class I/II-fold pyridoxal phosphate-dependent enzyme [Candidatus Krumholzibacteriia bacterium]